MTPHAKLLGDICDYLKSINAWYVRTNSHGYGRRGIPDVVACVNGRFLAIEAKVKPDKPNTWQERELLAIDQARGLTVVAYDLAKVRAACEGLLPNPEAAAQAERIIDELMDRR